MLTTVLLLAIGMFIGWNFPQPPYAKSLQERGLRYIKEIWNNFNGNSKPQ